MEKSPNFLSEKYADLPGSKSVERAVKKQLREGEQGPATKEDRIDAYMDRLEDIVDNERGFELLKNKILNKFAMNVADDETLEKIAEGLYESEKRIAIEQGRGQDIENLEARGDVIEKYKPLILEKAEIQRKTLEDWLDYLQQNDAKQPMSFRYFVVRSLEKMGALDKEKITYSKRTPTTVAPFPELNSEALGWVYKRLESGIEPEDHLPPDKQKKLEQLLKSKDFAKLYAFAQIETAGKLNRESIEGEWRTYEQGSDPELLEKALKGKGTGWCTAEGSASSQLQSGDFYVYYSKSPTGYTEPRVAIRMEGDHVAEVRGVNQRQELEPELVDIAQAKYHDLPGGDSYDKKAEDMKKVTHLVNRQKKGDPFTKDDLIFLYEINAPIEGFGYDKDPRVAALRKERNPKQDASIVFECVPDEIAWNPDEVFDYTKAYVGPLFPGAFQTLGHLEHLYTSFPDGKITRQTIEIGGKSAKELEKELAVKGIQIDDYTKSMMKHKDFTTEKKSESADLVRLKVRDLGFPSDATTDEIYKKVEELGLELCPAEVGPQYCLVDDNQLMGEYISIGMKPIVDPDNGPYVFRVGHLGDGVRLTYYGARPDHPWRPEYSIVFRTRK